MNEVPVMNLKNLCYFEITVTNHHRFVVCNYTKLTRTKKAPCLLDSLYISVNNHKSRSSVLPITNAPSNQGWPTLCGGDAALETVTKDDVAG